MEGRVGVYVPGMGSMNAPPHFITPMTPLGFQIGTSIVTGLADLHSQCCSTADSGMTADHGKREHSP